MEHLSIIEKHPYEDNKLLTQEQGLINQKLPLEIFEKILSYLDPKDIQSTCLVSRFWRVISIDALKHKISSEIIQLVNFLRFNINQESYPTQRDELLKITDENTILNSNNLAQIQTAALATREKTLNALKYLEDADLKNLETLTTKESKPVLFENIFNGAKIYQKFENDRAKNSHYSTFDSISKYLNSLEYLEKCIEFINSRYSTQNTKDFSLNNLSTCLLDSISNLNGLKKFDRAIQVAKKIHDKPIRDQTLVPIVRSLTKNEEYDKAIEIANAISCPATKESSFYDIVKQSIERNDFEISVKVIPLLDNNFDSHIFYRQITDKLITEGNFNKPFEIAAKLSNVSTRDEILTDIYRKSIKADRLDIALKAIKKMSAENQYLMESIKEICMKFIEKYEFEKAADLSKIIPKADPLVRDFFLSQISLKLGEEGNRDKAVEVAHLISDESRRELVLNCIENGVY